MNNILKNYLSHSPEETLAIAQKFVLEQKEKIQQGLIVALKGELGLGKSLWAKAMIAKLVALPEEEILSPTFTLVEEYTSLKGQKIFHVDLYRLEKASDLEVLDVENLFKKGNLCLVEWPERAPSWRAYWDLEILFKKPKEGLREITIQSIEALT
ncbi:MAG: tRNA (adenosine(37)-N6)-threonylcarbamoyltransferase complex ATPase subunit type 1 TsaE [Deltaproteobacteria bacterium]|nr:tRNA (adenosine(37)-N6)-threonylcarbamoyltransferase complex ATPase subunit type 1 TsaE [Deltaproteobacteria bacterium]